TRAALEAIAWRVADILALIDARELRVDGGLTRSDTLMQLQADVTGIPVRRTGADATARGVAALAAVGARRIASTAAIEDLIKVEDPIEPRTDTTWRQTGHEHWRRFVEITAASR